MNKKKLQLAQEFVIDSINIDLTCEFDANFASFSVRGVTDEKNRSFKESANNLFNLGSRIDINIGYGEDLEKVLLVLLVEYTTIYRREVRELLWLIVWILKGL